MVRPRNTKFGMQNFEDELQEHL